MDISNLNEQQKEMIVKLELRKLDRDYKRCMDADFGEKLEKFDMAETPNLDKLKQEVEKIKKEALEKEEEEGEDDFEGLDVGYAPLGGSSDEEGGEDKAEEYEKEDEVPQVTIDKSRADKKIDKQHLIDCSSKLAEIDFKPPEWAKEMNDNDWDLMFKKMIQETKGKA